MNTDFEDLVAETLQRRAATVRIPANLAGLAHRVRRQRRRRYVMRSGLTAATAAGLAVAIPLATQAGPPRTGSRTLPAQTLAYVVRHAELSIAARAKTDIEVARDIYPGPGFGWVFPNRSKFVAHSTATWTYGISYRIEFYAADARPLEDGSWVFAPPLPGSDERAGRQTTVDYLARTWWHEYLPPTSINYSPPAPPASCNPEDVPATGTPIGDWAPTVPWLRFGLRCGSFRLAGRQRVDGINAIKIVADSASNMQVIWVSAKTYLPVQSLTYGTLAEYHWLPATPRNLALLNAPIPAGFRQVNGDG
jgi:hypothetical protein